MPTKRILILFFLLQFIAFVIPVSLRAQSSRFVFDHINLPELKDNGIFCITEDKDGFLWIGTNNGLYRYDGYKTTHYEFDPNNANTILTGPIRALFFDSKGFLWIGLRGSGVCRMDIKKENFLRLVSDPQKPDNSLPSNGVMSIAEDRDGNIWIGTEDAGVCKYNPVKNSYENFNKSNSCLGSNMILALYSDHRKGFHIGAHTGGAYIYDFKSGKLMPHPMPEVFKLSHDMVYFYEDSHENTWLVTPNDLYKINSITGKLIKDYGINSRSSVKSIGGTYIYEDRDGIMWITSNNGTGMYRIVNDSLTHISNLKKGPHNLSSNLIHHVFEDKAGNLWIGTANGVDKLGYLQKRGLIKNYSMPDERFATEYSIRHVYKDKDGVLWGGSSGAGLLKIFYDGRIKKYKFLPDSNLYGYNYVNYIYEKQNKLWVCCPRGLFVFDKAKEKFTGSFLSDENPFLKNSKHFYSIWSICEAPGDNNFWVGSRDSGLILFNPEKKTGINFRNIKGDASSLHNNTIWYIFKDRDGDTWLCTDDGLTKIINGKNGVTFKNYIPDISRKDGLHAHHIWHMIEDKDGYFWLATSDGGLCKFDRKTEKFINYTTRDNLPSNTVCGILEDDNNKLWVSTINGVCVFDIAMGKGTVTYNVSNGLEGNCFNFKSCFKSSGSQMLFGGTEGISEINASSIRESNFNPNLSITLFDVLYKDRRTDITDGHEIMLQYNENAFAIEFAALDFTNPEKNRFAYRLIGLDTNWTYSATRHYTSFSNLSPGQYEFQLRGTNSDGHWSKKTFSFRISIVPPFWRRWWFILFVLIAIGLIVYSSIIGDIRRKQQKRNALLAQLTSLRAQLNPHFIFNALNSIQHFINSNEKKIANSFLSKFATLIRSTLENSSKELISIKEELDFLKLYTDLESLRLDGKVAFNFIVEPSIDASKVKIPPMLLQPLIENSIIHGLVGLQPNGKIDITFFKRDNAIICKVCDNGIGRTRAGELREGSHIIKHNSAGVKLILERLRLISLSMNTKCELIYNDIFNGAGQVEGTCAELILPII